MAPIHSNTDVGNRGDTREPISGEDPRGSGDSPSTSHAVDLTATEARGGERQGLYRVLVVSMAFAVLAVAVAWIALGWNTHVVSTHTSPSGQPASGGPA